MTYQETIDYLFTRLPMFSRIGAAAIKKDLHNTIALCEALDNPYQHFKSIHIAGTNGKGSVSHMLAAILQTAGYKTGLYTSPHLHDFRERIKVNGEMIAEQYVVDFTKRVQPLIDEIEPSFFEITVAMAFEYFKDQKVDIAVIEVGLGGRLDSTNIITPELSIITNIGWDHMNLLGDSLEKIAYEKAGIIKQQIPVVVGETLPETKPVFEQKANAMQAPLHFSYDEFNVSGKKTIDHKLVVDVQERKTKTAFQYTLDLPGVYQTKNILTALSSVRQLQQQGWKISEEHVQTALATSRQINGLHGRWEVIHEHPTVVMDVGHNEDGVKQIVAQLKESSYNKLHIIIGMVKDKEIEKVLALLPTEATYYFTKAHIPRALPEADLHARASVFKLEGETFEDVNSAISTALHYAAKDDLILVCGSVFLVGEVDVKAIDNRQ
ncbi:bifunctional folylpolyglutamate synthase/dihydrofolate synthase [Lacibacter sediminis]|uniref:Dihydrofolate synthase/folylpolyglutamate synthase n=1 Tax=Lacibacter sediminis TaxID=2760713 RepID=A0A7G5XBN2_9BACT|nr:folylpolyglutamate synthase/dihydrofolate synthase family protein [Lacibacter sediminis]QNA42885.1 bifunctional folylpolyglutamate synthase/dihydrofolate synthase [Lacibacter sediminis]